MKRLETLLPALKIRNRIIFSLREFFRENDFIEIETPVIGQPLPEAHIEAIESERGFLRTSHEAFLKPLLAAGYGKIFEIGPCFRREECGRLHREEFTMLEWYQEGISSSELLAFTKKLIICTAEKTLGKTKLNYLNTEIELNCDWEIISLKDAFAKFAGCEISSAVENNTFEINLIEKIEPALPKNKPCILKDYPSEFRAYSALSKENPLFADRWELYIAGMEIANACTEAVDECEIRKIISQSRKKRKDMQMKEYPLNPVFEEALKKGFPPSAGCAIGIDRLCMLFCNAKSIHEVKL